MSAERRVAVGRLTSVFGVRGELKCLPTSAGAGAFAAGRSYSLGASAGARELRCVGARKHHERLLLAFEGIATPEDARALTGLELFADHALVELAPGEYLDADLIGLRLIDEAGRELGKVVGVQHFPAQDCLVVGPGRALVPMVKAFIGAIDLEAGTVATTLPEGLIEG